MTKRFSFKDLLMFGAMTLVMILTVLAMYMVDRQWSMLSEMRSVMREQAADIRGLRTDIKTMDARLAVRPRTVSPPKESASTAKVVQAAPETSGVSPADAFARAHTLTTRPGYSPGDWLVRAIGVSLKTITPLVSSDKYSADVQDLVLDTLLVRNPQTLEWQGLIAQSWWVSDDGLTITFRLRPDVRFSDGETLDATDVAFTYNFIMNDDVAAPRHRAYLDKIAAVTPNGPHEVAFRFVEPYFDALSLAGTLPVLAEHFYGPYLEDPTKFNESKGLLLGSGPYRLSDPKSWTPDLGLVDLERNPRYWGDVQPSYDRLLWKVIENDSARLTTFRNGDIDTYGARPREYAKLVQDVQIQSRTQRFEFMSPVVGYRYIGWNQKRAGTQTRFADRRVRQALTFLSNRAAIIDEIMLGYGEAAVSPFSPRSKQHDPSVVARPYDLERAKALLVNAGFLDRDGDGVLEDTAGEPFEFELVYFQDSEDTKRIVSFLKDAYARAGILLKPKPSEWSVMLDLIGTRDFDAISLGWTSGIETDVYQMFHSSQIDDRGDNFIHFENTKFDRLVDEARATVVESERMPLWQAVERIFFEEQPYTFLTRGKTLAFIDKRLRNLEVTKLGLNLSLTPVETFVPAAEHRYAD